MSNKFYQIGTFAMFPKNISKYENLSNNAKLLYMYMLDTYSLSIKNEWKDAQGTYIFFTLEKISSTHAFSLSLPLCSKRVYT